MSGYTAKQVAKLLDLSVDKVRAYARLGLLEPERGARGEYRFSFQDLVLLRTARGLMEARIPPRKVREALSRLKKQLPSDRPLSGVQIVAQGENILVRDGETVWDPESGQSQFNFRVDELADKVRPHAVPRSEEPAPMTIATGQDRRLTAADWYAAGSDLEATPEQAREAYRRALELDPYHADARVNLGRLLHEAGHVQSAQAHYRMALTVEPHNATALFNLGVALEDLGQDHAAVRSYLQAIERDAFYADAFYNLARLMEKMGDSANAVRYLKAYRKLTDDA